MKILPISSITIPEWRQRRQFDESKIMELADSIERIGLINPITIKDGSILAAGERRLRAVKFLSMVGKTFTFAGVSVPKDYIPTIDFGELSPTQAFEIELDENIQREDLTFQERALALKRRQELLAELSGETIESPDLAEKIYGYRGGKASQIVRRSLIVAEHLDRPEVQKAKTLDDAFKFLVADEQRKKRQAAGEQLPSQLLKSQHHFWFGDFQKVYDGPPVDIIITDPPYGINADQFGAGGAKLTKGLTLNHNYSDSSGKEWNTLMQDFADFADKNTKLHAHLWCFCDIDGFHFLRDLFYKHGWFVHRTPFIYFKPWQSCAQIPNNIRRTYELILFARRSTERSLNMILPDTFTANLESNLGHAAQKPIGVYTELLKRSARPGDLILDPFCGSGPVFPAAHKAKCIGLGCERESEFAAIVAKRLEELE